MQNLENVDVFESLIKQKLLKCPQDPFVRSALNYICQSLRCEILSLNTVNLKFRINRATSNDQDVEIDGHWFPANTVLQYSIYYFHRSPEFYPEPEEFKPER